MELDLSGLACGFDWKLVVVERTPQRRARREQYEISEKNRILSLVEDELTALQNKSKALKDSDLLSIQGDLFAARDGYVEGRCGQPITSPNQHSPRAGCLNQAAFASQLGGLHVIPK